MVTSKIYLIGTKNLQNVIPKRGTSLTLIDQDNNSLTKELASDISALGCLDLSSFITLPISCIPEISPAEIISWIAVFNASPDSA